MRDRRPFITYTVKNGDLIRTSILQKGAFRQSISPTGSFLELGDHEVAHALRGLGISRKPFMSRYAVERAAILPAGESWKKECAPWRATTARTGGESRRGIRAEEIALQREIPSGRAGLRGSG